MTFSIVACDPAVRHAMSPQASGALGSAEAQVSAAALPSPSSTVEEPPSDDPGN
jgi:hypothetical protein